MAGGGPARGVFGVGGAKHGNPARPAQIWQPLDQRLGAGRGDQMSRVGRPEGAGGGDSQIVDGGGVGQALPDLGSQRRDGIGPRVDPGAEIKPRLGGVAKAQPCGSQIAAMVGDDRKSGGKGRGGRHRWRKHPEAQ